MTLPEGTSKTHYSSGEEFQVGDHVRVLVAIGGRFHCRYEVHDGIECITDGIEKDCGAVRLLSFSGRRSLGTVLHISCLELIERDSEHIPAQSTILDLKKLNMDGRKMCAKCSTTLAEPWPGIRHCKQCEP